MLSQTLSLEEGKGLGPPPPPIQDHPKRTSTGDILPDTDRGSGATAKGSHGATGLQARKLLGAPHRTRGVSSTRGCCPGLSEVSQAIAPLHYPS